ncbi:MAG: hypothetical protein ABI844_07680 [Saprospiraceae bacterium]
MKRIVFTVQVFGLVAAFPLYVITELNQVKTPSPLSKTRPEVIETREIPVSMILSDTTAAFEIHYLSINMQYNQLTCKPT